MDKIIEKIKQELKQNADEGTRKGSHRFFKEEVLVYGVKSSIASKISKEYFKTISNRPKSEIFELCDKLWQSGYSEEAYIACNWSYYINKAYEPSDFIIFEKWVNKYVTNWATCDTLCNHTVGAFIEMYPDHLVKLKEWAKSSNCWVRRASAVSLIVPSKKGKFLKEILEIVDILLCDKEDLVQKGYGWMLKAASQAHQKVIFDYVIRNKKIMPRTALRYAIEKMPNDLKKVAMKK